MTGARPRYTLIKKFLTGFAIIIGVMALASLTIINQVKTIFLTNQNEFESIQITQMMATTLEDQDATARTTFPTGGG